MIPGPEGEIEMPEPVMEDIWKVLLNGKICVLATSGDDVPHTSLMAYVAAPDCRTIYLTTRRQTRKYRNLKENPEVSLLIDTRCEDMLENIRALTVSGVAGEVTDAGVLTSIRRLFEKNRPGLADVFDATDSAFIAVSVRSFQLLSGVRESKFVKLDRSG
jgi:uncharacterized pyridoxamine 5'-phosphate oxidase family protein